MTTKTTAAAAAAAAAVEYNEDGDRLEVEIPDDLPDRMTQLSNELAIRVVYPHFIRRDKRTYTLRSVRMEKIYKAVIRKRYSAVCEMGGPPKKDPNDPRKILPKQTNPFDTLPYGFRPPPVAPEGL